MSHDASTAPAGLLLSASQAAQLLDVSAQEVLALAKAGRLPVAAMTPGGHRRYTLEAVLALREKLQQQQESESGQPVRVTDHLEE